jgi:hypothetical protein
MKMTKLVFWFAAALTGCFVGVALWAPVQQGQPRPLTAAEKAAVERQAIDTRYSAKGAKKSYQAFVEKHKASPDPKVQDQVSSARLRIAHLTAREKDFKAARSEFLTAAKEHKGTASMSPEFGGMVDKALYQAAATLNAEGRKAEARAAFVKFIKDQPLSPLVHGAYKRIVAMDGKATAEIDALLQAAMNKQAKVMRFETSVCGPKAAVHLLKLKGLAAPGYKALAKECGTTDSGTTLEGLKKGLAAHGVKTFGFELNRKDFARMPLPAILLAADHYVVITAVTDDCFVAYDPRYDSVGKRPLPALNDPHFTATVLITEPMPLQDETR